MDWRTHIFLLLSVFLDATTSSQIDCFLDEQECQIDADNLINFVTEVATSEECGQLCNDDSTCTAFTHFGATSFPFHEECFLFSSCRNRRPCTDCITGSNQADCVCSIEYTGYVDETNLVDIIGSVADEYACKKLCASDGDCSVYTFYGPGDKVNPNLCLLLNKEGLQNPVRICDNCTTGPGHCNTNQECQVAVFAYGVGTGQEIMTDLVLHVEKSDSLSFEAKEQGCYVNMSFIAIGAGGGGGYYGKSGGGSGLLNFTQNKIFTDNLLHLEVGQDDSQTSYVSIDQEILVVAAGGGNGDGYGGGGYSGGGGCGEFYEGGADGGSNGSDGKNGTKYPGGDGNRFDLSTLPVQNFFLAPGAGGLAEGESGGGGGGVLVDGKTPYNITRNGKGYGAGGGGDSYSGLPGCILIET